MRWTLGLLPGCLRGLLTAGCLLERGFLATSGLIEIGTVGANRQSGLSNLGGGSVVKGS